MSWVKAMLTNLLSMDAISSEPLTGSVQRPSLVASLQMDWRRGFGSRRNEPGGRETGRLQAGRAANAASATVKISPPDSVRRYAFALDGMTVETVEATSCERIEYRFRGTRHLLTVCEQGARSDGDTFVEGLPKSSLHDLTKKLTFVPAGREYHERQTPRSSGRVVYIYFDPAKMPIYSDTVSTDLAPRLYFEDPVIWETALRLRDEADSDNYRDALGVVLAHEIVRLNSGASRVRAPIRGGLAAWQQRAVAAYIEEHLSERTSLATLARLARLSPWHFSRAFKRSFGMPPHRFHTSRRIECAKSLLAKSAPSVTEIALTVGYSETSSFSSTFREVTGFTPTDYRRRHLAYGDQLCVCERPIALNKSAR
jgi:AraC family transcriptional regulator